MKPTILLLLSIILFQTNLQAQDAKALIKSVNKKFAAVKDYKADVLMKFALPGIKINSMKGKVYYKRPNKLRVKAKGVFFTPKNNPMKDIPKILSNTSSYTAVISGYETVQGERCAVVNVIPLNPNLELIIGKFWIRAKDPLIYKSEITTKENGTIRTQNFYGKYAKNALPDKIQIRIEMKKFKVPKMLALDLKNKRSKVNAGGSNSGAIFMFMNNYKINTKFSSKVFTEK